MDDRTVRTDRIEDVDRGVERRLSGAGDPDDWGDGRGDERRTGR